MSVSVLAGSNGNPLQTRLLLGFVTAAAVVAITYHYRPDSPLWMPAAIAAIALAIWHGAFDLVLARGVLQPRFADAWELPFYVTYVALAAAVVGSWYLIPGATLVAFLLYSAFHFGTEAGLGSSVFPVVSATAFGFVPISAACRWQPHAVAPIFDVMLRGSTSAAAHITADAGAALLPVLLLALAGPIGRSRQFAQRSILIAAELLLFRFCPPVLAFAVFFCAWHTPEHLLSTSYDRKGSFSFAVMRWNLRKGLVPWLASLAAVAIAAYAGRHTLQAYAGLLFIALSALTVPHMALALLIEAAHSRGAVHSSTAIGRP